MQLQKLEIRGFKSFGDKITIHFDKGITGIVGPNGCGKSNVVDSIRWVLGEQSTKNLRSEKMENIIFNGTKNRKPLQMAEVSLTFDNTKNILPTEYSQVTITRRYYRAGEGEYLLNGVPCRLKDINNLFLDTGIGSDSYAIIELKMIDSILNDTDHSRSTLFEEAAGISKFKIRKKETLKKLEETDADLSRVDDLLFEINKNLRTLEKQAKQAQKYYQTKEEYKNFSVLLAQKTVKDQQNLLVNLDQKIQAEQDRKMAFSAQSDLKESENEAKKLDILNKEKSLIFGQKALNAHLDKIRQNESEKKLRSERLNFLNEKIQNLSNQILLEKQSTQGIEAVLQSLNQQKNNAEKQLADSEMSLETLKKSLSEQKIQTQNVQNQVDEFAKKIKSKEEQISQQQKKREIAKLQIASLRNEIEQNTTDSEQQKHKIKQFEQELTDLAEELNEKTAELEQIREEEEDLQAQIKSEKVKLEQERSFLVQINRQLDALQNEFELTKSLEESLEGFPEAIKFLKKQPDWYENIPLFSDILTCEDEYKVAIENYLKTYMDFYVVDLPEQALQAIRLLEKHDKGKANFFVLSELNKKFPKINKPEENQNMIWAMDIVEFDAKYNALMTFLLQNVFIAEDEWAKQQIFGAKQIVLAKNGGIIYGNHRISGGSVGIFEGKRIGRAKNLEKLTLKIDQLQTEITQCSERIILEQKNIENLKNHTQNDLILALQLEIGALKEKSSSLKSRKEELQKNIDLSQARLKAKEEQLQDLQDQLIDLEPISKESEEELENWKELFLQEEDHLISAKKQLERQSASFNEQNLLFYQAQNSVQSLEQELHFRQTAQENSQKRIEKFEKEQAETQTQIDGFSENRITDELLNSLYEERKNIESGVNEAEKEVFQVRGEVLENERILQNLRKNRENAEQLIAEFQQKINENKMQMLSVKERLSVEFEIDLDEILAKNTEQIQETEQVLRAQAQKSKEDLQKIGQINPMAVEAYQEILERYEFIDKQKNDLVQAKESLQQTINEIDTVAKAKFLDAFYQIREHFINVFRTLFSEEDTCDLTLSNPNAPLESKIEIIAKPKGKRPLTINQLSGGEKTLTATALLFSIYLLRPAPFCIFDEVDAPLDDANIDKFNNIIKKFSEHSQFIIVTHNKRTMASTDVIYGVTMLEQGVSQVLPIDLREWAV